MRPAAIAAGLALAFAAEAVAADEAPALARDGDRLRLTRLPPLLAAAEVREHLDSGLTTTFVFAVTVRDRGRGRAAGGARVAVRYELWDEDYLVSALGADGALERGRFESFERLLEWWRGLDLTVLAESRGLDRAAPWEARLRLSLVPFSQAEQDDAQRWLARSLGGGGPAGRDELAAAAEDGPPPLSALLDLLTVTSIVRRSLRSWEWELAAAAPGSR